MSEIVGITARGKLAAPSVEPPGSVSVDVVLYARFADGRVVDTRGAEDSLGFDVHMTKSVGVRRGDPVDAASARLTEDDVRRIVAESARGGLDLLEQAVGAVGDFDLARVPISVELEERLVERLMRR